MTRNGNKGILLLAVIALAWLVLPTGDPSDILVTLPLIGILGIKVYLIVALGVFILYKEAKERS